MQKRGSRQAWVGTENCCERMKTNLRDGLKGPESKTEPKRRTIVVKPFSRAESHLRGEGGVLAQADQQPGLLLVFLSWHRNFCAEFQGSSTPKMLLWNRRDHKASTVRAGLWDSTEEQAVPRLSLQSRQAASSASALCLLAPFLH